MRVISCSATAHVAQWDRCHRRTSPELCRPEQGGLRCAALSPLCPSPPQPPPLSSRVPAHPQGLRVCLCLHHVAVPGHWRGHVLLPFCCVSAMVALWGRCSLWCPRLPLCMPQFPPRSCRMQLAPCHALRSAHPCSRCSAHVAVCICLCGQGWVDGSGWSRVGCFVVVVTTVSR